jgi:hypothetical protein
VSKQPPRIHIALFADHFSAIHQLGKWFEADWTPYDGLDELGDAETPLAAWVACSLAHTPTNRRHGAL